MIVDTDRLRTCLRIIRAQGAEEITVTPGDSGWDMISVSPDHVTVAYAQLSANAFPEGYEKWNVFCVNLPMFADMLSGLKGACDMDISTGRLVIKADGYTYRKPLYDPMTPPKLPNPVWETQVMLSADLIRDFLDKAAKSGDAGTVRFTVNELGLTLASEDGAGYGLSLTVPADRCAVLIGEASALYPLQEWANFIKALPAGAELDISIGDDYPVGVIAADGVYYAKWICAPRIEDGE